MEEKSFQEFDPQLVQKIKERISEIISPKQNTEQNKSSGGGLFLTGFTGFLDYLSQNSIIEAIRQQNIHSVLTVTKGHGLSFEQYNNIIEQKQDQNQSQITHKIIPIDDDPDENIQQYFNDSIEFIQQQLDQNKNVLVHCVAGISRSASIVISYIMKSQNVGYERARSIVQEKRPQVHPNTGFQRQLRIFQKLEMTNLQDSDNYILKN